MQWLSLETGQPYRLLSEAEFEYALRAGTDSPYPWGYSEQNACEYANILDLSRRKPSSAPDRRVRCRDHFKGLAPIGSFRPNNFGLFDMTGNVWEWVEDCYVPSFTDAAPIDGSPLTNRSCARRVARGGSYLSGSFLTTPQNELGYEQRRGFKPNSRHPGKGFRIARTLKIEHNPER